MRIKSCATLAAISLLICACEPVPHSYAPISYGEADIPGAPGQPAGFYPGRAFEIFPSEAPQYKEYLGTQAQQIAEVRAAIEAIKAGKKTPGCIGQLLTDCIATLSLQFTITSDLDSPIFRQPKIDVNGQKKPAFFSGVIYWMPEDGNHPPANIEFTMDTDGRVTHMTAGLWSDPATANTQEEYDATGLHKFLLSVLPPICPQTDKVKAAQWFQNEIKPQLHTGDYQTEVDLDNISRSVNTSAPTQHLCGRNITYLSYVGVSTDLPDPHAAFMLDIE